MKNSSNDGFKGHLTVKMVQNMMKSITFLKIDPAIQISVDIFFIMYRVNAIFLIHLRAIPPIITLLAENF